MTSEAITEQLIQKFSCGSMHLDCPSLCMLMYVLLNRHHDINEETVELVHLILQTLIEMCVGNYSNQLVIFNQQILETLNSIFQIDITERHGEYAEKVSGLLGRMYTHALILTHTTQPLTPPIHTYH